MSKKLLYTWQECFAKTLIDVKLIDLIKHFIDFKLNTRQSYFKILRDTEKKCKFCDRIFLEIEETGIIIWASSD